MPYARDFIISFLYHATHALIIITKSITGENWFIFHYIAKFYVFSEQ